jgi:coenzyme F420-reducing hydrogenase beta subunit
MNAIGPREIIRSGLCIGCGSCVAQSSAASASMQFDADGQLRPHGPASWSDDTARFTRTCPFSPTAADEDTLAGELFPQVPLQDRSVGRVLQAYVGFVAEESFRDNGSSGGMTSWVASELLRRGWVDAVAHVHATDDPQQDGRFFRYRLSRSVDEIHAGAKSRYYPVEMSEVLRIMQAEEGRYAIVGIPCFIKAVQLMRREHPVLRERIRYTLGLFCGHMKSARFVESLAWQMSVPLNEVARVDFRRKIPGRPANWYNATLTLRDGSTVSKDWWHLADGDWGAGFFMDAACNFCDDVTAETADASFGDAWVEPYSSDWNGNNVVVVRSPAIGELISGAIEDGRLKLECVDADFVARTQAAGLRQRREGLAYRLARRRSVVQPRKRFAAYTHSVSARRRLIYRMRSSISAWSHRVFRFARRTGAARLYIAWASAVGGIYHALAYPRGRIDKIAERIGLR